MYIKGERENRSANVYARTTIPTVFFSDLFLLESYHSKTTAVLLSPTCICRVVHSRAPDELSWSGLSI